MLHRALKNRIHRSRAFTLVELMVSLTVFSIVMLISTSTLLIMIDANAKAQALYSASTNLSFALDSITREIRMGYGYHCSEIVGDADQGVATEANDCSYGGRYIAFSREWDSERIAYRLYEDNNGVGRIEMKADSTGEWLPITSDDIDVDTFEIVVANTDTYDDSNDTNQPFVDIMIQGKTNNGLDQATDFNIQSHIVQRRLDRR
jgi:prepilin-type N-terminal cleavage/methylation domain-containing protein